MKTKKRLFNKRLIAIMLTAFMATTAAFAAQRSLEEMKSIAYAPDFGNASPKILLQVE